MCARPRAQQSPSMPTRPISLHLPRYPTLLRPSTGALRQHIPLRPYHYPQVLGCLPNPKGTVSSSPAASRELPWALRRNPLGIHLFRERDVGNGKPAATAHRASELAASHLYIRCCNHMHKRRLTLLSSCALVPAFPLSAGRREMAGCHSQAGRWWQRLPSRDGWEGSYGKD